MGVQHELVGNHALKLKLDVIVETAHAMTEMIDADRATRLELAVVVLIVLELVASIVEIALLWRTG